MERKHEQALTNIRNLRYEFKFDEDNSVQPSTGFFSRNPSSTSVAANLRMNTTTAFLSRAGSNSSSATNQVQTAANPTSTTRAKKRTAYEDFFDTSIRYAKCWR